MHKYFPQGFLLSSSQQVDRYVLHTGELARTLKRTMSSNAMGGEAANNANSLIQWTDALTADAENSKQVSDKHLLKQRGNIIS